MSHIPTQFEYLGQWHDTKHFRAFVYSATDQKLANNYTEFTNLVGSGLWFPTKAEAIAHVEPVVVEQKIEKIVPALEEKVQERAQELEKPVLQESVIEKKAPLEVKKPVDEPKTKRETVKNQFRAATSLGK